MHPTRLSEEVLLADCTVRTDRRSGPGGQHRNKVETAVILVHNPTGIKAEASERRSQADNKRVAVSRLRLNLALHWRENLAPDSEPSDLWRARCRSGRIQISLTHADFPAMLSELCDYLAACEFDVALAARPLEVTPSQIVKLLRSYPAALTLVNAQRIERGLHKLT